MVAWHSESNAILVRAFQSKHDSHRIAAYQHLHHRLAQRHAEPDVHILDNEVSTAFKHTIEANNCTVQLVPPHVHRRNRAERAIRTFKDHFLALLAGTDPHFPRDCWDLLLPQAELTLNLLRPNSNATGSVWEALFGPFDFNATPLGPAGCRVLIHAKATLCRSWDNRCEEGFYTGPALNHYRCYTMLHKNTGLQRITDAVKFRHHYLPTPEPPTEDKLLHALQAIHTTMARTSPATTEDQLEAINTLCQILHSYKQAKETTTLPGVTAHAIPRVALPGVVPQNSTPPPSATPAPTVDGWTTVGARHTSSPNQQLQQPIAQQTRAKLNRSNLTTNYFAALAEHTDHDEDAYQPSPPDAHPLACPVLDITTGKELEHRQLRAHPAYKETWDASYANELGRLCQGIGQSMTNATKKRVEGMDTFRPIQVHDIPAEHRGDVTYTHVVCEVRPQKEDPNRTRITIGGNRICYPGDTGTKTGSLELVKLILNDVLSTKQARFACFDISNFYLGTPLDRPKYVRIKFADIPAEFTNEYNLDTYVHNGWVYFEISKGIYGLKQAGKLANDLLTDRLDAYGYYQCATTPGLWRHKWRPITFVLIVDDFGLKYVDKRHADHLLAALSDSYKVTTDWSGSKFAGIDLT